MSARSFITRWEFLGGYDFGEPVASLKEALREAIVQSKWGASWDEDFEILDADTSEVVMDSAKIARILRGERKSRGVRRGRLILSANISI